MQADFESAPSIEKWPRTSRGWVGSYTHMTRKVELHIEDESSAHLVHSSPPLGYDPVVVELRTPSGKNVVAPPEMATDLLGTFGGFTPSAFKEVSQSAAQKRCSGHMVATKLVTVNVPVFNTLMVKRLTDHPTNPNEILLCGTMIQRSLFVEPSLVESSGQERAAADGFVVRVNDSVSGAGATEVRKVVEAELKHHGEPTGFTSVSVTSSVEYPMKRVCVFHRHPFTVTACELMLELTSFAGRVDPETKHEYEFRPDLMCHTDDIRNLVSIRDWREGLDDMQEFDLLNTSPTVEYFLDAKHARDGTPTAVYVPRVRLTFYLYKDWVQPFLTSLVPIIFICLGQLLNGAYSLKLAFRAGGHNYAEEPFDDQEILARISEFLSSELTLGLTLVFMIPQLSSSESLTNELDVNHFFVAILFLGLILGSIGGVTHNYVFWLSNVVMWGSLTIPISNFVYYRRLVAKLHAASPRVSAPYTFNGRPGKSGKNLKGSEVALECISPFWTSIDGKLRENPRINEKEWPFVAWRIVETNDGHVSSIYSGVRREDIGSHSHVQEEVQRVTQFKKSHSTQNLNVENGVRNSTLMGSSSSVHTGNRSRNDSSGDSIRSTGDSFS